MQPESPTSPPASRTGASRGRSLNLGISIPAELLQDSDARRLAKVPRFSSELEVAAAELPSQPAAETVAGPIATEQFCYHDAVSLAHCLSSPVADLNRVDTAQFNKFHLYHGWRWLTAHKTKSLTHPKDKEATAEAKAQLLYDEGYWVTLEQWAVGDSMPAGLSATGNALIKLWNMRALSLRMTVNSFSAAAFSSFVFFRWAS